MGFQASSGRPGRHCEAPRRASHTSSHPRIVTKQRGLLPTLQSVPFLLSCWLCPLELGWTWGRTDSGFQAGSSRLSEARQPWGEKHTFWLKPKELEKLSGILLRGRAVGLAQGPRAAGTAVTWRAVLARNEGGRQTRAASQQVAPPPPEDTLSPKEPAESPHFLAW